MATKAQDHDEDPRLALDAGLGVVHETDVAEVNLRDLTRWGLHADGDVRR